MVNPGIFHGTRFDFLMSEKASYKAGVDGGYTADAVAKIQSRYFRRYPVEIPLDEEPSAEFLLAVDDEKPDVEQQRPDPEKLTVDEYEAEVERLKERAELIATRKKQIKGWMYYQYMKDQDLDPTESGALNAFRILLLRQTGVGPSKPRHRTPVEVWRKITANREAIAKLAKDQGANKQTGAKIRSTIAKTMFEDLDESTRAEYAALAEQENKELDENWSRNTSGPFSTAPVDRQKFIECIAPIFEPFLDMIVEATGWRVSLFAGGPEPADEGHLNVISVHSGKTKGDVPLKFPAADRPRYKQVVANFSDFLRKCYTVEECQASALSKDEGYTPVAAGATTNGEESVCFHHVRPRESTPPQDVPEAPSTMPAPAPTLSTFASSNAPQTGPSTVLEPTAPAPSALASSKNPVTTSTIGSRAVIDGQDGVSMMEGLTPTSEQPSSASGHSTLPIDRADSPPLTPPPHSLFHLAPSPSLLRSPPASPSVSTHITIEKSASPTAVVIQTQKRKEAPTEDHADNGKSTSTISNRSTKKAKTLSATNRSTRTRCASGGASSSATTIQADHASQTVTPTLTSAPPLPPLSNTPHPSWFTSAIGMLEDGDLGPSWNQLVKAWAAFEAKSDFKELKKLSTTNRPSAVKSWIQRARTSAWRPVISNLADYESEFTAWWSSLQPEWRKSSSGKILFSKVDGDWEVLRRPGLNGILSVMAALFFWGVALQEDSCTGWNDAVSDCLIVLTALCAE